LKGEVGGAGIYVSDKKFRNMLALAKGDEYVDTEKIIAPK
jgi:hypothetical protein